MNLLKKLEQFSEDYDNNELYPESNYYSKIPVPVINIDAECYYLQKSKKTFLS